MFGGISHLIKQLKEEGTLRSPAIITALETIDRIDFVPEKYENEAYGDYPIPIGHGQTVPQPHTIVFMLEHLHLEKGDRVLEVGSGSGWATALIGNIVGVTGHVYGVEIIPELVEIGKKNIAQYPMPHIEIHSAKAQLGLPEFAPFDKILVSASAKELPHELLWQLKIGGRMIIPIGNSICKVTRTSETKTDIKRYKGFVFVPLIH